LLPFACLSACRFYAFSAILRVTADVPAGAKNATKCLTLCQNVWFTGFYADKMSLLVFACGYGLRFDLSVGETAKAG